MATPAHWKPLLLAALDSNAHLKHSAFFQLATVGINGRPANRTVVFRGFQDHSDKIHVNTDARSSKIEEVKQRPYGELREKAWFVSSLKSRLQYLGPTPRLPCISEESTIVNQLDISVGPMDAFCLLVFDPEQILRSYCVHKYEDVQLDLLHHYCSFC